MMVIVSSCEDFVDVGLPSTQVTSDNVFNEKGLAEAAVLENYALLRENVLLTGKSDGISILLGLYTDELDNWLVTNRSFQSFYSNTIVPSEPLLQNTWNNAYTLIYNCNRIIEGLKASTNITQSEKDTLIGETLFIRTLAHFYLSQLFNEIPYVTTTDYRLNATIKKKKQTEMFALLEDDALEAERLLNLEGKNIENTRVNSSTVQFFLARLYLYQKDWTKALDFSNQLINGGKYVLESNLSNIFLKESKGTVWQLKPSVEGFNTYEAQSFIFFSAPPPNRSITKSLIESFEPGDLRKEKWTSALTSNSSDYYFASKYKQEKSTSSSKEYSIIFRMEEMYYVRLEALLHLGMFDRALEEWNFLRNRYGLEVFTSIANDWEFRLIKERRHEFFCELGHRFFDLRRTSLLEGEMQKVKPMWKNWFAQLPLPESELLLNPNLLPQNEGY